MKEKIGEFFWENKWACLIVGAIVGLIASAILTHFGGDFFSCLAGVGLGCGIVALILRFGT